MMNANQRPRDFSDEIWRFFLNHRQTNELRARKFRLRDVLLKILKPHLESDYDQINLRIVGSTTNGLANNSSDVDMCLMMTPKEHMRPKVSNCEPFIPSNINLSEHQTSILTPPPPPSTPAIHSPSNQKEKSNSNTSEPIITFPEESFDNFIELESFEKIQILDNSYTLNESVSSSGNGQLDNESIELLEVVKNVLENYSNFVTSLQIIKAKVPILKFFDSISKIEVTLNVNKSVSIRNTQLILDYTKIDWRFAPLTMAIKAWANEHGINNAFKKSISSYSLVLMVIHFLQEGVQPQVLPCLHQLQPHKYNNEIDIKLVRITKERIGLPRWQSYNRSTLSQLLLGFLEYYSYKFPFNTMAISVRLGKKIPKFHAQNYPSSDNAPGHWKYLSIEEPFDRTNTARSVYDKETFDRILGVFRISHYTLRQQRTLKSIITFGGPNKPMHHN